MDTHLQQIQLVKGTLVIEEVNRDTDSYVTIVRLTRELQESRNQNKEKLIKFVDYIEEYKNENTFFPSIDIIRNNWLPLFNK